MSDPIVHLPPQSINTHYETAIINATSNSTVGIGISTQIPFIIPPGKYTRESQIMAIHSGISVAPTATVVSRSDCAYITRNQVTQATLNGKQFLQTFSLAEQQLNYYQTEMIPLEPYNIQLLNTALTTLNGAAIKCKQAWRNLGVGVGSTSQTFVQTFYLHHFFPYVFDEEETFEVHSALSFQLGVNTTNCLVSFTTLDGTSPAFLSSNLQVLIVLKSVQGHTPPPLVPGTGKIIRKQIMQPFLIGTSSGPVVFTYSAGSNQQVAYFQFLLTRTSGTMINFEDCAALVMGSSQITKDSLLFIRSDIGPNVTSSIQTCFAMMRQSKSGINFNNMLASHESDLFSASTMLNGNIQGDGSTSLQFYVAVIFDEQH